ncbi:MAG TPA: hypothetical protein VG937_35720 [Polyangiaceae bacterium]|nr:hypothetical protein [Polyangiaceae bacterium]
MAVTRPSPVAQRAQERGVALLFALLTVAEARLIVGALLRNRDQVAFVLHNASAILAGTPVWKSSQHRLLGPALLRVLEPLIRDPALALGWLLGLGILAENLLLWRLFRREGSGRAVAFASIATFGLLHFLSLYKLEYPWDSLDVLLFTGFGYWASLQARLRVLLPLVLLGLFNHETVLYVPLWCALAVTDSALSPTRRQRELLWGVIGLVATIAGILLLREVLYVGPASLPAHAIDSATPWLANPLHLRHNLRQFWIENWGAGRAWISVSLLLALWVLLAAVCKRRPETRAALWSLLVLLTVFCFGYVNETRLYLPLFAFWFGYRGPSAARYLTHRLRLSREN